MSSSPSAPTTIVWFRRDLRLMLLAAPLVIDQSLKQDARGFG